MEWGRLEDDWVLSETAGVQEVMLRTGGKTGDSTRAARAREEY